MTTRSAASNTNFSSTDAPAATWRNAGLRLAATGLVALLTACAGEPSIQTGDDADVVMGNLNKVDNARVDMAYVDPDGDYGRYSKVYVAPLDLDNVEIVQPSSGSSLANRYNREWELTGENRTQLQAAYLEVIERELAKDGAFEITRMGGDDVLAIEAVLTTIAPNAPRDDMDSRSPGRSRVYSEGGGSVSIAVVFADGDSGEVLGIMKDTYSTQNTGSWGINNSVTNMADVRRAFSSWGTRMRTGLTRLRQLASES